MCANSWKPALIDILDSNIEEMARPPELIANLPSAMEAKSA